MKANINIKFYLKNTNKKEFHKKIAGRIIHDRKKSEFMTDIYIIEEDWDEKFSRSKSDKDLNQRLTLIEADIYRVKEQLVMEGYEISSKLIKEVYTGASKVKYRVVEYIQRFIENKEKDTTLSKTYFFKFRRLKKIISIFIKSKYHVSDIMLSRVDYAFITSFNNFLKSQISEQYKKPLAPTTINKQHSFFRTVMIQANKEGFIKKQPYVDFKIRKVKTDIKYLTKEELSRLENLDLKGYLQKSVDVFLFSVYTGLRFRDAQHLTIENIDYINSKPKFITTIQEKTGDQVVIPIIKPTQKLLDKYQNDDDRIKLGRLIPKMSNVKINLYLKLIGELTEIKLKLTHHVARHTCATTVLLENNVPLEQVSKWLGHADISSTLVYGKITKSRLDLTAEKLNKNY